MIGKAQVIALAKTKATAVVAASIVSAAAGVAGGIAYASKKLGQKYADLANKEIAEARQYYGVLRKMDGYETPESALEQLGIFDEAADAIDAMNEYKADTFKAEVPVETVEDVVAKLSSSERVNRNYNTVAVQKAEALVQNYNVFTNPETAPTQWSWDDELNSRSPELPYVLSKEEFYSNKTDFEQLTLTYFAGDNVLVDARDDTPVQTADLLVGNSNLERFGWWSDDARVVYIRNEELRLEFEINLSDGAYAREVLGYEEEKPRPNYNNVRRVPNPPNVPARSRFDGGNRVPL